ncbi:MAG: hypothetical protein J6O89_01475 [Aeriscardovia sp.]|nr:hypothetical protein [Aeriscardovia sp.]
MLFRKYYCIKQQEQKDCSCACLATIFKQFGLKIPIYKIRDLAKTDIRNKRIWFNDGCGKTGVFRQGIYV